MLSIGLLVLGTIGYFEKIFNLHIPRRLCTVFLIIYISLYITNIIYSHHKENNAKQKLYGAEARLNNITEYGDVATYTFNGYQKFGVIAFPCTPVVNWNVGHIINENNFYHSECSADDLQYYINIIAKCTKFPFPYIAVSLCLLANHDHTWKTYALKAKSILEITTTIPLHCKDHDGWLVQINKLLDPAQRNSVFRPISPTPYGEGLSIPR